MANSPLNTQIVTLYEMEGLSPEEISEGLGGLEVASIKAVLLSESSSYRKKCTGLEESYGKEENEIITDAEFEDVKKAYKQLAIYSEIDAVRERAGRFLINEKLGRNKGLAAIEKGRSLNITLINAHLERSKEQATKILEPSEEKNTIDV